MKTNHIFLGISICCFILMTSCKRENPNKNVVFLASAERTVTTTLTVDTAGGSLAVIAKSAQLVVNDVQATVAVDTSLIAAYNQAMGKHYSALPSGSYSLSNTTLTIKSGQNLSDAINFIVTSSKSLKDGVSYMMPVTIKSSSGLSVLDASKTVYIVINKVIVSTVASLKNNYFTVDFSKNPELSKMTSLTFETRLLVNNFQAQTPFISSVMGIEETFLIRFGDVSIPNNRMQIAGGSTATNVPMDFSTGVWYHVAAVYDGAQLKVYINGQLQATTTASRTIDLTNSWAGGFHFGYSSNGRLLDGAISEARIWSRALSPGDIANGMCVVDPSTPGLIGYWKFNEGTGKIAHDISGKGHDATANAGVTWIPNVRCN